MSDTGLGFGDTEMPIHCPKTLKEIDHHNILRYVPWERKAQ